MLEIFKQKSKRILCIGGPTGVGESTVTKEIIKKYPKFKRLVTATPRPPRLQERNGIDYFFFSRNKFFEEEKKGNIPEVNYVKIRDVYYGCYKLELEKQLKKGFNVIANIDATGAKYYKKNYKATSIFLVPDNQENLKKRLLKREPDMSKKELEKRLQDAEVETQEDAKFYDYIVTNKQGQLDKTIKKITQILKKEGYSLK